MESVEGGGVWFRTVVCGLDGAGRIDRRPQRGSETPPRKGRSFFFRFVGRKGREWRPKFRPALNPAQISCRGNPAQTVYLAQICFSRVVYNTHELHVATDNEDLKGQLVKIQE